MSGTTAELFAETLEKTDAWLQQLAADLGHVAPQHAYSVLRVVLHALRDRLTVEEAADLGAQLPMLVRGFYYEGWRPTGKPIKYRQKEEFLQRIADHYRGIEGTQLEPAVRAVFRLLAAHITPGELNDVRDQLPENLQRLWYLPGFQ